MLQELSERLPARASAADIERIADGFLASPRVVVLAEGTARESLRRADGRLSLGHRVYRAEDPRARDSVGAGQALVGRRSGYRFHAKGALA